jgi:hypothetical protein
MFIITFEDEIYHQWTCEYIFDNFDVAKTYLIGQGFIEKNRLFERKDYNWSKYVKAYISQRKLYKSML